MSDDDDSPFLGPAASEAAYRSEERAYSRENFASNFDRLLGIHRLTAEQASKLLGISPTTLSYWRTGQRDPNLTSLQRVAEFFEVDPMKLLGQWTGSFIQEELADAERWQRVEDKIHPPTLHTA